MPGSVLPLQVSLLRAAVAETLAWLQVAPENARKPQQASNSRNPVGPAQGPGFAASSALGSSLPKGLP